MPAKVSRGLALIGASLVWCSCAGGSGGAPGAAGTNGGAGTTGAAGTTGPGGAAGATSGTGGQGGPTSGSGGGGSSGGGATGGGNAGTSGGAAGQGGRGGGSAGAAGGGPGTGGAGMAGRGGTGGGSAGRGGTAGGSPGGTTGTGGASTGTGGLPGAYDKENTGADCPAPPAPVAMSALPTIANLPDPFQMTNGTRISTRDQWRCRRAEISSIMQHWVSGPKGAPPSNVTATFSGTTLTVVVTQGSTSITLSSTITTPSGAGPFPVVISMDGSGVPSSIFTSRGVATMNFTSSQLVPSAFSVTRGAGAYFSIYPDTNAGAMIEWAWGVSRLIDGLEKTASQNKIDTKHIAVKGCSYSGKMALYAGAFDERIALTIPEESGGGGEASWRFMATQTGTEDLDAAQGTAWYAANLKAFHNADAPKLPVDMHELVAMVAPRAILAVENTSIDRLGSQAGYVSMRAASEVYKALGVPDRIGYTQAAASAHCSFPSSQTADVQAFVDKFLAGMANVNTNIAKTSYNTDFTRWITWTTPTLQ